ncbi:hypothetical protein AAZV13_13G056600 [Glycine max]
MACTPDKIKSIDRSRETLKLAIRITDLWFVGTPNKSEQAEMGDEIHVVCKPDQLKSWKADLKENCTYVMHNFKWPSVILYSLEKLLLAVLSLLE